MNEKLKTLKVHCFSETISPLTHMMETAGNESLINKEKICYNGIIKNIPVISGNAFRHRAIREPMAMHIVEELGLKGKLTIDQANYMFYGGTLKESTVSENMKTIAEMQKLFPAFRLIGGSLRNQIVAGSLISQRGILFCEENRIIINSFLPEEYKIENDNVWKISDDFIKQYQYTRGDAQKRGDASDILSETDENVNSNLMIYVGQAIIPGSFFYHGFILNKVSDLEIGSFFLALKNWKKAGNTIGGQSRIGHGILNTKYFIESDNFVFLDIEKYISNYKNHVLENKEACVDWLNKTFSEKKKKEKTLLEV